MKALALIILFLGEALSIGAELVASKKVIAQPGEFYSIFFWMLIPIVLGGALLVAGYMLGYLYIKNIWIIAAVSVGSILVLEPILIALLFREAPTVGAVIGLILGALGIIFALFW